MTPRQRLGIVIALVVVVGLAGAVALATNGNTDPATTNAHSDPAANATITVGANGVVTAPPDVAMVTLAVEASSNSAESARAAVAENVSRLRTALSRANVTADRIRTTAFTIRSVRDENGTVTYYAVHQLELRLPVADAGRIVDTAVGAGATRVDGVTFTLVESTRRDLRATAIEHALANARTDADVVANATALSVRSVTSVQTADADVGPVLSERATAPGTIFTPGPVTVTASVTVTYAAD